MEDEMMFACYQSRAQIDGKPVLIDVKKSKEIKRKAVLRGFTNSRGAIRARLSWLEKLVIMIRDMTTRADFNHEWCTMPRSIRKRDTPI